MLPQWVGCVRFILNVKSNDDAISSRSMRKYRPVGIDARQIKSRKFTPLLFDCRGQIIRHLAINRYQSGQKFMKGQFGKPITFRGSFWLTCGLFQFNFSLVVLFISTIRLIKLVISRLNFIDLVTNCSHFGGSLVPELPPYYPLGASTVSGS